MRALGLRGGMLCGMALLAVPLRANLCRRFAQSNLNKEPLDAVP